MLKKFTKEDLIDPIVSKNAETVLKNRYLAKDENGQISEDSKEMYMRVASAIASAEVPEKEEEYAIKFYEIMAKNEFLPNSPTLMNAGRDLGMLSACFVLPVEDDLNEIMETCKNVALVQRAGGGTGFSFSKLRPNGSIVKSSGGTTAGPLSFIEVFSGATHAIQQGAFRRGANMGILSVEHPDIVDFINAKEDLSRWQNYNVSVSITDTWMNSLLEESSTPQHRVSHSKWGKGRLWKENKTGKVVAIVDKKNQVDNTTDYTPWTVEDTWDLICTRAHATGEPGLFFVDKANRDNVVKHLGLYEATNPCGEQPLLPYDSCNLGSINLSKFFDKKSKYFINKKALSEAVKTSVRFLDNVIEINRYPIDQIRDMSEKTRRIGLGVMGWADFLFMANIPYDSSKALEIASEISSLITDEAIETSKHLAEEKGVFAAFTGSEWEQRGIPIRNSFLTTIAPTGTISIIANCSGGIEPIFALAFQRTVMPDAKGVFQKMWELNPYFEESLSLFPEELKEDILNYAKNNGNIHKYNLKSEYFDYLDQFNKIKDVFVTSHDIEPINHVKMQAAWQRNIDSAVSKTINLSHDAKVSTVSEVYKTAYTLQCKGITVYRDGCRDNIEGMKQPMSVKKEVVTEDKWREGGLIPEKFEKKLEAEKPFLKKDSKNSDFSEAVRFKYKTQFGNLHVIVVIDDGGNAKEVFTQLGKAGQMVYADLEAMTRLVSVGLQNGIPLEDITAQLYGIGSNQMAPGPNGKINSLPDALAKALIYWKETYKKTDKAGNFDTKLSDHFDSNYGVICPSCNTGTLAFQEGCKKCMSCGFSAC